MGYLIKSELCITAYSIRLLQPFRMPRPHTCISCDFTESLQKDSEQDLSIYSAVATGSWAPGDEVEAMKKYCTRQLTLILSHAPNWKGKLLLD